MLSTADVARAVHGDHIGVDTQFESVSTDTRTIENGALFVALRGERFDGHEYVDEAIKKGASAAMLESAVESSIPQVIVQDTEQALGELAAYWRRQFNFPVVAVTGSNGKTTVKEMIGHILRTNAQTSVSKGNFNNPIGLPLSLLKLRQSHQFAVVEIGMNQIGEIERLAQLAQPTVSVITNAGAAHLENLVSIEQVAVEKGKIIESLGKHGVAVLNADSPHYAHWQATAAKRKIVSFGFSDQADVSAQHVALKFASKIQIQSPVGTVEVELQLAGDHNVINALAASAVGIALEVPLSQIKAGLESMRAVAGRLQLRQHFRGGPLIDDTYNANPNSVAAALSYISRLSGDRRLVLGDMFELGAKGEKYHREVGRLARGSGIGRLYALGELSASAAQEFGRGAIHFSDRDSLLRELGTDLDATTTVLIKGSRGMKMDEIADFLCVRESDSPTERSC